MKSAEIRQKFLDFFESKGHTIVPSAPMVIKDDPTLMFTNAGMNQFKDIILGNINPKHRRVADSQKCLRVSGKHNDLEEVGHDTYHHTMFEMLGNWSFGDYFKEDAIAFAWEFLTGVMGLDKNRLYATVFEGSKEDGLEGDAEARKIWMNYLSEDRILFGNKKDNFWEMGDMGPCGPCSEIHIDLRPEEERKLKSGRELVNQDNPLVIEIWNLVFMQYNRKADGSLENLPNHHVDTGMGFERLCMAVQGKTSNYDTDVFTPIIDEISRLSGLKYGVSHDADVAMRVIADHLRTISFSITDGQLPSNVKAGYVIRRILRRAVRYAYTYLDQKEAFMYRLVPVLIEVMGKHYPELVAQQELIEKVIREEENAFLRTLDKGIKLLDRIIEKTKAEDFLTIPGNVAFELYDTYGFPLDLTKEILEEKGYTVNEEAFQTCMNEQKEKARSARKTTNYMGADVTVYESIDPSVTSTFVGYETQECDSKITVMTTDTELTEALTDGQAGTIFVDETPFYATGGGQHADSGVITCKDGEFIVEDVVKMLGGKIGHIGHVTKGMFKVGDTVTLSVNKAQRADTAKGHSATHLLQKSLRTVLGNHVEQSGSYVDKDRLRFDFSHFQALTAEELAEVEKMVNEKIAEDLTVSTEIMSVDEAKNTGAMALFGEKYGDKVRVVTMGDFSKEFCAGTHVPHTGVIKAFKIISETGVAAGIRRIEALTGDGVMKYYLDEEKTLHEAAKAAKAEPHKLAEKIQSMLDEIKALSAENEKLKDQIAKSEVADVMDQVVEAGDYKVLPVSVKDVDMNALRTLGDDLKGKIGSGVVILASDMGGKVNLIVTATDDAVKAGAHAGKIIKEAAALVGGGGGGRPNMAQAGGKNPAGIKAALEKAVEIAKEQL